MIYTEEVVIYSTFVMSYMTLYINIDIIMKHPKEQINYMIFPGTLLSCYLATHMTLDILGIYKTESSH